MIEQKKKATKCFINGVRDQCLSETSTTTLAKIRKFFKV